MNNKINIKEKLFAIAQVIYRNKINIKLTKKKKKEQASNE